MITDQQLNNWFSYHPPTDEQRTKYVLIRDKARELAAVIVANTPSSADQTAALRKLRESVMTANAAIACNGDKSL